MKSKSKIQMIQENKALALELYLDYGDFSLYMAKAGKKVMEWKNITLKEVDNIIETYFNE